ncbi:15-hydroxyprostaglandin dehydrogenase [NAD+] [Elysia marginata]|uniref:15-hydroxyprostaglandin dehydrogenase [NAD(+)] n=1 Tax=Elysia marginata TaxID=1093978 RepID=A0AAV4IHA1_9GAST|nr:15-hydroxyprostaglandin dehydrogenase [NAD+] [Elysia marginata]
MDSRSWKVFLTGGAQGLGKSYMDALLAAGSKVFFVDINATAGESTEKEFTQKYGRDLVKFQAIDCTVVKQFEEAFATAVSFLGYINLMVNNAGLMDESKVEETIRLNYLTVVRGTYIAAKHMRVDRGGKGGRIINISSIAGLQDINLLPVYCSTKHAVRAFTSCLALAPDIQQQGIEYGILCPDPAATSMFLDVDDKKMLYLDTFPREIRDAMTAPVETITKGFMKLLSLDEMNGAILHTSEKAMSFRRMDNVDLGQTWPPAKQDEDNNSG